MDADHEQLFVDVSYRKDLASEMESDPNPDYFERIKLALLNDDAAGFVELMNNIPSDVDPLVEEIELYNIWSNMSKWDCVNCAVALLDGQLNKYLTHSWLSFLGRSFDAPLHHFVANRAFKTTAALLHQKGYSADVRCNIYYYPFAHVLRGVLPINVILASLRHQIMIWCNEGEPYATKVVFQLCGVEYRGTLETLRVLAPNTREVKQEFFNYLNQGKMIEVGALLLVAKSCILSSSTSTAIREGEFRSIFEIRDFVLNTKNNKSVEMEEEILVLLDILDKSGDKLAALLRLDFMQTPFYPYCTMRLVRSLIEDAGYDGAKHFNDLYRSRSENPEYKRRLDECDMIMRTSVKWPSWVNKAASRGFSGKSASTSRLTYPFGDKGPSSTNPPLRPPTYAYPNPMPANLTGVHHLQKMTATRMFRLG